MKKGEEKKRPYWHVDAKWISGILLSFLLCTMIFSYGLMKVTERDIAVEISAYAIAATFSSNGLSDTTEINDMKDMIKSSEDGAISPIPGINLSIALEDLEGKTPEEARLAIFRRIAEPLYEGPEGISRITTEEEVAKNIQESQGLLSIFTRETNIMFRMQFMVIALVSIAFLALTIFFSHGFGRLVSPAMVALFVGLPNAIFWGIFKLVSSGINEVKIPFISGAQGNDKLVSSVTEIATNALPTIADVFYRSYGYLVVASGALMLVALIGKIVSAVRQKKV